MSSNTAFLLAALLFALAFAMIAGLLARQRLSRYAPQAVMTGNEADFFFRLVRANPNGYVFPQVAMSALIAPVARGAKSRLLAFRRISQKRVDYALYTDKLELICIVELDDRTHDPERDAVRDSYLESAGIVTLRWHSTLKPSEAEIRARLEQVRPADGFFSYRADGRGW